MKSLFRALIPLSYLFCSVNATPDPHVLVPMSDDGWPGLEHQQAKRAESHPMTLQQMEHFVWGSDSGGGVFANMTLGTNDEQLVISMERFAGQLKAVNCSENMSMSFIDNSTYQNAIDDWEWVNFNESRTFILVANAPGCGDAASRQPWIVRNVQYDDEHFTVHLNATMKSWQDIGKSNSFSLDFGKYSPPANAKTKRLDIGKIIPDKIDLPGKALDVDLPDKIDIDLPNPKISDTKSFTIPLNKPIPGQLFKQASFGNFNLGIECVACGLQGSIELQGHIESGVGGLTQFTITAIPHSVAADLTLQLTGSGTLGKGWQKTFDILRFGIPALTIPKVLTIGPNIQFEAGFDISQISGSAVVTTGVVATIPDASKASVDFKNKKKLDLQGWTPKFTTKPVTINAQVDASMGIFFKVNVAVSLEALGNGFNLDLGLKIPEINVNADARVDSTQEVCPNSGKHAGLNIRTSAGAELLLEAYTELGGHRDYFLQQPLFSKPNFFNFPSVCLPLGGKKQATTLATKVLGQPTDVGEVPSSTGTGRHVSTKASSTAKATGKPKGGNKAT